jgi:CheY-like chemotaxis protein
MDKKTKILIVEDDHVSLFLLQQVLKKRFEKLFFAETGGQTFDTWKAESPDIILMDIRLPDTSGLEVVKKIRESDPDVKIIAQTAYAMLEDERNALDAGCNEVITKPVDKKLLLSKIEQQFNKKTVE